ncbi:MAG: fasciclin domain-containing protein [Planctomycetota bacterium]|nr:fasciclin domain-containing protein [Planctomycetota bacterium]
MSRLTRHTPIAATAIALAAAVGFSGPALAGNCSSGGYASSEKSSCGSASTAALASYESKPDIVDTAVSAGSFNTLVAAVKAAGLVDALKGDGPFTVFAPTDDAFAKLPKGTLESLLKPENKALLTSILTYHVVPGRLMAADVVKADSAGTLNGQQVDIKASKSGVKIDNARVIKTDIATRNGVIHVIDSVILPSTDNIVKTASKAGAFNTLLAAATAAGLADTLSNGGPFTVFAPTDEAFAKLPAGTIDALLKPENKDKLQAILTYHVVPGRIYAADALKAGTAKTVQGKSVHIRAEKGKAFINDAQIVSTDIDTSNGVIHVIDSVILP